MVIVSESFAHWAGWVRDRICGFLLDTIRPRLDHGVSQYSALDSIRKTRGLHAES